MADESEYLHIPGYVPVKEAARMLGLSQDRVFQHIHSNRFTAKKVGGRYMIPIHEVEDFKRNPPGRSRTDPPNWRVHDRRIKLLHTEIKVRVRDGQQEQFEQRVDQIFEQQQHRFTGTAERFILKNITEPDLVALVLVSKDNEMPDEATRQRELEAFKADFADVLDWETAEISLNEGMIYT